MLIFFLHRSEAKKCMLTMVELIHQGLEQKSLFLFVQPMGTDF
uniref:Uncharacterized protein n=1 Tax=Rhizophora mucronata TaxID=61149 RepID=A0A2P2Q8F4_RHIMU